jgi:hypothetical protein
MGMGLGMAAVGQSLSPGEIVKNSGKFSKPTKIPGKNYSKDEIIIRNADSGKGKKKKIPFRNQNLGQTLNNNIFTPH